MQTYEHMYMCTHIISEYVRTDIHNIFIKFQDGFKIHLPVVSAINLGGLEIWG